MTITLQAAWAGPSAAAWMIDFPPADWTPVRLEDEELPPLPVERFTGDFAWLAPLDGDEGLPPIEVIPEELDDYLMERGSKLPASFRTFLDRADLQQRIPAGADEWAEELTPTSSPAEDDAYLIPLLEDVQGGGYTYLYLAPDGTAPVVTLPEDWDPEELDDIEEDGADDETADDFIDAAKLAAPDFESFLYRYWIELRALGELQEERSWEQLSPEVQSYLSFYRD